MKVRSFVVLSLVLLSLTGCSSGPPEMPDPAAPAVKAEEARLAALVSAERTVLGERGVCTVRLLGQQAGVSFVWAHCQALDSTQAVSVPLRVDGVKVRKAGDGAAYSESVREMFPEDLAEFVIDHPDSPELRPSATPTPPTDG